MSALGLVLVELRDEFQGALPLVGKEGAERVALGAGADKILARQRLAAAEGIVAEEGNVGAPVGGVDEQGGKSRSKQRQVCEEAGHPSVAVGVGVNADEAEMDVGVGIQQGGAGIRGIGVFVVQKFARTGRLLQ